MTHGCQHRRNNEGGPSKDKQSTFVLTLTTTSSPFLSFTRCPNDLAPFTKMVLRSTIVFFLLTSLAQMVAGQNIVYDAEHNATTIIGTWSSGSRNVQTGPVCRIPCVLSATSLTVCRNSQTQQSGRLPILTPRVSLIHCMIFLRFAPPGRLTFNLSDNDGTYEVARYRFVSNGASARAHSVYFDC